MRCVADFLQTDQITECEELSDGARSDAERCQLDAAESKARECANIISTVLQRSVDQFREGIRTANSEFDKYECEKNFFLIASVLGSEHLSSPFSAASSVNVDFAPVTAFATQVVTALEAAKVSAAALSTAIAKLKADAKAAAPKAGSAATSKPAAPPSGGNSPTYAPQAADAMVGSAPPPKPEKRTSVSFGIKDLAALRKKSVTEGQCI